MEEFYKILHKNPELSGYEYETNLLVIKEMMKYDVKIVNNKLSVVCFFDKKNKETIAFRSELDALPIIENESHLIRSNNNNMHACGHDIHTSSLLSLASYVQNNSFKKNIAFIFQSKEEGGLGARDLIETSIIEDLNITQIIGMHVWPNLDFNKVYSSKNLMFGSYELDVFIKGENNHISSYNKKTDATFASYEVFKKLYQNKKKYITHLGKISSGKIRNVSSNEAVLNYSIRFKNDNLIREKIIAKKYKTNCDILYKFNGYYPPLINDKELLRKVDYTKIKTLKSAEDFGYYSKKCMTLYLLFGIGKLYNLHTSDFYTTKEIRLAYCEKLKEIINVLSN